MAEILPVKYIRKCFVQFAKAVHPDLVATHAVGNSMLVLDQNQKVLQFANELMESYTGKQAQSSLLYSERWKVTHSSRFQFYTIPNHNETVSKSGLIERCFKPRISGICAENGANSERHVIQTLLLQLFSSAGIHVDIPNDRPLKPIMSFPALLSRMEAKMTQSIPRYEPIHTPAQAALSFIIPPNIASDIANASVNTFFADWWGLIQRDIKNFEQSIDTFGQTIPWKVLISISNQSNPPYTIIYDAFLIIFHSNINKAP
jgi:hypothetical protein